MAAATITTAVVTAGTNSHATTSYEANAYATDFVTQGVVGTITSPGGSSASTGAFAVTQDASPDLGVTVLLGNAYVTGTPSGQASQTLRAYMSTNYTSYTINANASGSTKFDWIYLMFSPTAAANPDAGADNVITLFTSRSTSNTSDTGSPPTYGLLLAVVTVANGASTITNSNISDKRTQVTLSLTSTTNTGGWTPLSLPFGTVTYNGNRSYTCTFTGIDLTGILSPGMRLRTTRTVPAPTQSTNLNGSTQFYSKTSPAGMTFTDNWTQMAWVKLSSYQAGVISGRRTANTSGFDIEATAAGQLQILGLNASSFRGSVTYQSLPLSRWMHVAATGTMSTNTFNLYINGVLVPGSSVVSGTPTAIVQSGDYVVGAETSGTNPFAGEITQEAVFSAVLSQSTIQSYISQGLAGTETSLISAHSFNGNANDLNANANNLTANGSAVATNADSPFGGQAGGTISSTLDYGIVQAVTFSTNTTVVVQVPEGCTIPTSGGVSAVVYSSNKVSYGFPAQKAKWQISSIYKISVPAPATVINTWYNPAGQLIIPIGEWRYGHESIAVAVGSSGNISVQVTLSTSSSAETNSLLTTQLNASAVSQIDGLSKREDDTSLTTATPYFLNIRYTAGTAISLLQMQGSDDPVVIKADNSYL